MSSGKTRCWPGLFQVWRTPKFGQRNGPDENRLCPIREHYTAGHNAKVMLEILKGEQTLAEVSAVYGVHPTQLGKWKAQSLEGLPCMFEGERRVEGAREGGHEREGEKLHAEIGWLGTQLAWLQENLTASLTRAERVSLIEREDPDVSLVMQA